MSVVAVHDSSILIDLLKINLLDRCLQLPYVFGTSRFIMEEIDEGQIILIQPHIDSGKFQIFHFSAEDVNFLKIESREDRRLSEEDWSALYCARQHSGILLTGDRLLRAMAVNKAVQVHGILWILEELVLKLIIDKFEAVGLLRSLMTINPRLPGRECEELIESWEL